MITQEWIYQVERQLPFAPTEGQHNAITIFSEFMADPKENVAMVLRGSAGTGKTSVARAIVSAMSFMKMKVVLLAPTGRAAKVFSLGINHSAFTIHRRIYRQKSYMVGQFSLNDNLHTDTLFIVDEASMISHDTFGGEVFGSGNLLDDLVKFVYSGRNCRMLLIGDTAQLPPIGSDEAPALMTDFIEGYGLSVYDFDLMEVLRQAQESGILYNATLLRNMITYDDITELPKMHFEGFADISICPGNELVDELSTSYDRVGREETIVITRSNKRANIYNMGIRNQVLWREDELGSGDQLMIVKNNYFWMNPDPSAKKEKIEGAPEFLANGDHCVVARVHNERELYGFRFVDMTVRFPDYGDFELETVAIVDTLLSDAPALTREQQEKLFNGVMEDYADVPLKQDRFAKLKQDRFFNALQIKYAYAITCHKAQGGQWEHVYLDQGYMTDDMLTPAYIHWLYTGFTRAKSHLYLVNWPKEQVADK